MSHPSRTSPNKAERTLWWIGVVGFWVLGLCNNFAYVVMLSAAHDILAAENFTTPDSHHANNSLDCNTVTTGVVLLADILPALVIKVTAPFFMHKIPYDIRFILIASFSAGTLIIVGLAKELALSLFGVACASISSGFGEITMLQLTSFFSESTVTAWSSGTGAAGILGALSYAGLTSEAVGVNPRTAILILLFIPVLQVISYIVIRINGDIKRRSHEPLRETDRHNRPLPSDVPITVTPKRSKWSMFKPLLKYMIPLSLVYFAEYLINQGLFELIYVRGPISHKEQYRWYSVCYQLGVFLSRSSLALFRINQLWLLPIIQFLNLGTFFVCIFRAASIPSVWLIFGLVVFEGLIGGGAYVNTFYKISLEIPEEDREFSLGVASVGDSFGITAAGLSAMPIHNAICRHFDWA